MNTVISVLIVTDDGEKNGGYLKWREQDRPDHIGKNSRDFHLGEFVDVLENTAWAGFELKITKAHRSEAGVDGMNAEALKADRGADVVGFKFDKPFVIGKVKQTLFDYDIVLFFPIKAGNPDPTFSAEVEAISKFMEAGGGIFVTGDHENLGGELAGLLPRVRNMRRWWSGRAGPNGEPKAPPGIGAQRHETTRPGSDNVTNFEDQSDDIAQPISPRYYDAGYSSNSGYPTQVNVPHPLLCSPLGDITWLPDHMHEGWCEVPDKLASRTFEIGGASHREYPDYTPIGVVAGHLPQPLAPEVVATGRVLAGVTSPALNPDQFGGFYPAEKKEFGVIGAWDGHRVKKGRVVVDSTWHHFFDINLTGDRHLEANYSTGIHSQKTKGFYVDDEAGLRSANHEYQKIQWYYRNIIYWLIPEERFESICWSALIQLIELPRFSEELAGLNTITPNSTLSAGHYLYFGQLADKYMNEYFGFSASLIVKNFLFRTESQFSELSTDLLDIWDPLAGQRVSRLTPRQRWLAAAGLSIQPGVFPKIALGAAVATAAAIRSDHDNMTLMASRQETIRIRWSEIHDHAIGELVKELEDGLNILLLVKESIHDEFLP